MKADSIQGLALAASLGEVKIGGKLDLDLQSVMPSVSSNKTIALLKEKQDRLWVFGLYWHGIRLCDVSIEIRKDEYHFEELA